MQEILQEDTEIFALIADEHCRQNDQIGLIASENIVSSAVMRAQGSVFTNKYAEGGPGKRYYGGCQYVDRVEALAIARACRLFGCQFANVQPHAGSQANQAVFFALLSLGDAILGMDLSAGGHLTHGHPANLSGKLFSVFSYGVSSETGFISPDTVRQEALRVRPRLIVAGASAYPRRIPFAAFREIADEVGAYFMADIAHIAGLVAAGEHESPFPHAHIVTTTTHKTLRGARGGMILTNDPELARRINKSVFPGLQGGPLVHAIAGKAVCFHEALQPAFRMYAASVRRNAQAMADTFLAHGEQLATGGTDTHMVLVDLRPRGVTGKQIQYALEDVGIICNRNVLPNDPLPPEEASGIRFGTASGTTRGFGEHEFCEIATWISEIIERPQDEVLRQRVRGKALEMCRRFPIEEIFSTASQATL